MHFQAEKTNEVKVDSLWQKTSKTFNYFLATVECLLGISV